MKLKLIFACIALLMVTSAAAAQNELTIKKKTSMRIPGMPAMPMGMANPFPERRSTEYIKGGNKRSDMESEERTKMGKKQRVTYTTITQCAKQRRISYNTKKKSYYSEPIAGGTSSSEVKNARSSGGKIILAATVTDTGERARIFGYDARHLKQTMTITPGPNSCQKETIKVDIDGWYIDLPQFACPIRRVPREFQMDSKCFDDVEYRMKGEVTGFAVKEIKTMTMQGMTINMEEEATEILTTPIADTMFEPPVGYKAANTLKEVEDDTEIADEAGIDRTIDAPETTSTNPTLAIPKAAAEKTGPVAKRPGVIRIGIVKPSVTLADKDSAETASDVADAIAGVFEEKLVGQNIEVVRLKTDAEATNNECDYVIKATVGQKHAGGGMLGQMFSLPKIPKQPDMTEPTPAAAELMGALSSSTKYKDEFTYDFQLIGMDRAPAAQKFGKVKVDYPGTDILSPPIRDAAVAFLAKVSR